MAKVTQLLAGFETDLWMSKRITKTNQSSVPSEELIKGRAFPKTINSIKKTMPSIQRTLQKDWFSPNVRRRIYTLQEHKKISVDLLSLL